jgi:hypothetical protein
MKKLAVRLIWAAVLVALGYWAWTAAFPNPRKVVRRRLEKLAQIASFSANEAPLAKLANLQKLTGFFSEQVVVNVDAPGEGAHVFNNRDELMQAVQAASMTLNGVQAKFTDPKIEMTPGNEEAIVGVVFTADVGGEKDAVVEELKIDMKKTGGDWLIARVESVDTLKQ